MPKNDKKNIIKRPSPKQIEKILDGWCNRHGQCWTYQADEDNVRKALEQLEKLMVKLNS